MTDLRLYNRAFLREFIHMYRDHNVLWDKNNELYLSENARFTAYADLQEKLYEVDKNATIETVRTKINSFRTNFRHEMRKIEAAEKSGKEYIPRLWYFYDMAFLTNKKLPEPIFKDVLLEKYKRTDTNDLRLCSKTFIKKFINLYRENECLWKVKSENYTNKKIKLIALEKLRQLYLKIDKNITINIIKSKINSLRTNFRYELRKVKESEKNGKVYKSGLYYFNDLMFLIEQDSNYNTLKTFSDSTTSENLDFKEFENIDLEKFFNHSSDKLSDDDDDKKDNIEKIEDVIMIDDIEEPSVAELLVEPIYTEPYNSKNDNSLKNVYEFENIEDFADSQSTSEADISESDIPSTSEQCYKKTEKEMNLSKKLDQQIKTIIIKNDSKKLNNNEENINTYAKFLVCELKMLTAEDRIFVKKLFNDIIFEAKLGNAKCMRLISNTKVQRSIN